MRMCSFSGLVHSSWAWFFGLWSKLEVAARLSSWKELWEAPLRVPCVGSRHGDLRLCEDQSAAGWTWTKLRRRSSRCELALRAGCSCWITQAWLQGNSLRCNTQLDDHEVRCRLDVRCGEETKTERKGELYCRSWCYAHSEARHLRAWVIGQRGSVPDGVQLSKRNCWLRVDAERFQLVA